MATRKRGLGRGLDALLGVEPALEPPAADDRDGQLREIPLDLIQRSQYQPRRNLDQEALRELARSIRAQGVMQPIVLRPLAAQRFEIIAGERRWRAAQMAERETIPAVVRKVSDRAAAAMALIENIQREDLNPVEEAAALQHLQQEYGLTHQELAEAVGKSRTAITNLLRLLRLPRELQSMLEEGQLEMGHARALLGLPEARQAAAASQIVARKLSVRQAEALVRQLLADQQRPAGSPPGLDPDTRRLQEELAARLGTGVRIKHTAQGRGTLVIPYNSLDQLDGILRHIK